jgi:aminopeptidase N
MNNMPKKIYSLLAFSFFFCSIASAQVPGSAIDVQHYTFSIRLNDQNDTIKGKAAIGVKFLKDANSFSIDLVKTNDKGKGMLVSGVTEKGAKVSFQQDNDAVSITASAKAGSEHTYTITYAGIPADGLIISKNKYGHRTFFGDNWPNRAHNWMPCMDDPADKATVEFKITAPAHYQVVANGAKVSEKDLADGFKETVWKESAPLSTKVMVIGVADFAIDDLGKVDNIPVYTYVFPEDKEVGFGGYAYAKEILPWYINKLGPYEFEKLANVQSKTIFGGLENAGCIFYFENSVGYNKMEELMAHEIAHQWFGDAASETRFAHLWLSEGFATFMTNVYLGSKYGEDISKQRFEDDRKKVLDFEKQRSTPVVDTTVKNNFMQLLNPNSYEKGGWALHMLHRKLGDKAFWKGVRNYYAKYEGGNASTEDLRHFLEEASGQNLELFFKQWVYSPGTPDLVIAWKYDAPKKVVELDITQKQGSLFDFPLDLSIAGKVHTLSIKDKATHVEIPVTSQPSTITPDPNVQLLARFEVAKEN